MKLEYSKIENYVSELNNVNKNINNELDRMKSSIVLAKNSWTGKASENYLEDIYDLFSVLEEFSNELNACSLYLKKCSDSYVELNDKIKRQIEEGLYNSKIFN